MAVRITTQPVTKEEPVSCVFICNKCGREADRLSKDEREVYEAQEFIGIDVVGGFCSKYPGDCARVKWHLCQCCHKELTDSFKIPANIEYDISQVIG